jgi:hypothetical protein
MYIFFPEIGIASVYCMKTKYTVTLLYIEEKVLYRKVKLYICAYMQKLRLFRFCWVTVCPCVFAFGTNSHDIVCAKLEQHTATRIHA